MIFQIVSEQWKPRRRTAEYKKIQDTESVGFAEFHGVRMELVFRTGKIWTELLLKASEYPETYTTLYFLDRLSTEICSLQLYGT
jgi:hypothetical protein